MSKQQQTNKQTNKQCNNVVFCLCSYASTDCGHLLEINYRRIAVLRVWHLLQDLSIHCIALHRKFCVTGSEDGFLRVWPMDFSSVFMEAGEKEGKKERNGDVVVCIL